ncbi:acid-shock protein [Paraburkholderia sp. 2C]
MKKLSLMWMAVSLAAGATPAFAQGGSSSVSSYSPPTEQHVKKPKHKKAKKGASVPAATPQGASQ